MTRIEKLDEFDSHDASMARRAPTIKTLALVAALLVYAAGFVLLYPIVTSSVAKSVSEGNDPALLQFVGP